ncbi:peter Pan-like protein [Hibiscus syriacus]|uniref:peter Pan-like protein n=1 Tax=Hibiscus syriacus TaxID=106335 RepID=UPI001920B60E|nr:peter Pan-like protein [Hibiscus syriacus]
MTLQLTKIEGGLCSGEVLFSEYGNGGNKRKAGSEEGNEKEDGENDDEMEGSDKDNEGGDNEQDIEEREEDDEED